MNHGKHVRTYKQGLFQGGREEGRGAYTPTNYIAPLEILVLHCHYTVINNAFRL